jgi:hypothetical protein
MSGWPKGGRPRKGAERLRQSLRRVGRALRARPPEIDPAGAQPHTSWEQQAEQRLRAIEQQLASQNRLLLITIITIVGETIYKVSVK